MVTAKAKQLSAGFSPCFIFVLLKGGCQLSCASQGYCVTMTGLNAINYIVTNR